MKKSDRQNLINYRLSRGKESIEEVKLLMEKEKYFAAMNRIYYGLFYVVNCLALIDDFTTSKHTQLIGYFNKNYVKTGIFPKEIGKFFKQSFENRSKSDYQDLVEFTKKQVEQDYEMMKKFITFAEGVIKEKLEKQI